MTKAIEKTQISLRTPTDMLESLDKVASAIDRDRSWVILRAIRSYLNGEGGDILRESDALASLDRGEGIPLDEVMKKMSAIVAHGTARKAG